MSQCGKSIPVQSMNPGCGNEIAVSLNTSEDVKSTICCQGWVICVSDMGLWKTSHPSSSQSRGKIRGQWGAWARQQSIHPNSSCKPGFGAMEFKKKPERKIKCYDWTSKARAFGKCHESQRVRKLVHREGTVRHALLTVGQPREKELASEFWHRHACNIKSYVQKWMARSTWTMPKTTFKTEEGKYTQYI